MNINDNERTRSNNNIDDIEEFNNSSVVADDLHIRNEAREKLIATELAIDLNDPEGFALYLSYVRKYPEELLRRALLRVMEVPINKIRKSRGALFNYLVQHYAEESEIKSDTRD